MDNKTLVICPSIKDYYFDHLHNKNIDVYGIFRPQVNDFFLLKAIKHFHYSITRAFYDRWYEDISKYKKIIVFDIALLSDHSLLSNIKRKVSSDTDCYLYSWNIVKSNDASFLFEKTEADRFGFKFFHYDHACCIKYNLNFNTIMYDKTLSLKTEPEEYDMFFLGFLKDRRSQIEQIYNMARDCGLIPKFVIVGEKEKSSPFTYSSRYIPYYQYLQMMNKSRAILDIAQYGQDGYSMRVMEAIFYDKKLITTNKSLLCADFYHPENILVIDKNGMPYDSMDSMKNFIDKPIIKYSKEIKDYYSFESWVGRFE